MLLVGADRLGSAVDDSADHFRVSGARLALTAPPNIAAPDDEAQGDDDGKDGGKTGAETGPMEVDERKPVVGLVQVHVCRFVVDLVGDREICLIVEDERRGRSCSRGRCSLPLSNPFVLLSDLVVD